MLAIRGRDSRSQVTGKKKATVVEGDTTVAAL